MKSFNAFLLSLQSFITDQKKRVGLSIKKLERGILP